MASQMTDGYILLIHKKKSHHETQENSYQSLDLPGSHTDRKWVMQTLLRN